ncbi:MAG TPA: ATP-dependent DNA helicase RecG [Acidimicrobiales bacterium]|nr:ATP-dependent DNA helicase RecG [Acidimicrobiales bacterium]
MSSGRTLPALSAIEVSRLQGVSERRATMLAELGIETVLDLVTTYPRRYIDRTRQADVSGLVVGDEAAVLATVQSSHARRARTGRAVVDVVVRDDTGRLKIVFFNQPWRAKQLEPGTEAIFFGKVTDYRGTRQMANPVVDVVAGVTPGRKTLRILPVYPASAKVGLTSWEIGAFVEEALQRAGEFADPLPDSWRTSLDLWGRSEAFGTIHAPESLAVVEPARRRLVFDELFRLQLALVLRRRAFEVNARALRHDVSPREVTGGVSDTLVARFLSGLPYELTTAQRRALAVIVADMAGPFPMHRLLQGDVGSGKTVVALATLLAAVQSGHQGALMVPTEVLAEQHFSAVRALLGDLEGPGGMFGGAVRVELLTSKIKGKARTAVLDGLASGDIGIVVGTHALLTEEVSFHSLGCVVIDEQHRFGVEQRATLRGKGADGDPDLLVMTATPIPRTAAMVIFGDLDLTTLDELPPGRTPVTTVWLPGPGGNGSGNSEKEHRGEDEAWDRVRSEVATGHRAFVVCPLVGESPRVEAKSATEEYERLAAGELSGLRVGLLHGQMAAAAREEVMARFRRGDVEVLVATTVIEVGVDVPEATVMVVESADRFGIAQLHQLRGRVGRGSSASWCYLLGGEDENERLAAVAGSTDGFALAEADLRLRGEGTLLGVRQKGQSDLRLASLTDEGDIELLGEAKKAAEAIVASDPRLDEHPDLADEVKLLLSEDEGEYLFKS